eukprot:5355553-Prymnesium_polylepis.1
MATYTECSPCQQRMSGDASKYCSPLGPAQVNIWMHFVMPVKSRLGRHPSRSSIKIAGLPRDASSDSNHCTARCTKQTAG